MTTYTIEFAAPTRPLSINEANRMHWAAKRSRLLPWKELVQVLWQTQHGVTVEGRATIAVHLAFPRAGRRDPHNYVGTVAKAIVDALVQAGAFPDDTPEYVTVPEPTLGVDPAQVCRVVVTCAS